MQAHDLERTLRRLRPSGWTEAAVRFRTDLRRAGRSQGRLLVVGTPDEEPWHLTAHLEQASRAPGAGDAPVPVLVRWRVPEGARPHLAVGLDELHRSAQGAAVLVAAPTTAGDDLLDRLDDARGRGATVFALHDGDDRLASLSHEALSAPTRALDPLRGWDTATHAVSASRLEVPRHWAVRPWR